MKMERLTLLAVVIALARLEAPTFGAAITDVRNGGFYGLIDSTHLALQSRATVSGQLRSESVVSSLDFTLDADFHFSLTASTFMSAGAVSNTEEWAYVSLRSVGKQWNDPDAVDYAFGRNDLKGIFRRTEGTVAGVLPPGQYHLEAEARRGSSRGGGTAGFSVDLKVQPEPVPEPTSATLLLCGVLCLTGRGRSRSVARR